MGEQEKKNFVNVEEKELLPRSGMIGVISQLIITAVVVLLFINAVKLLMVYEAGGWVAFAVTEIVVAALLFVVDIMLFAGYRVINPNEALVLTYFGNYYGTIKKSGFYYVNIFASNYNPCAATPLSIGTDGNGNVNAAVTGTNKKISTKTMTLSNDKQKVNDALGNPIIIGAMVIWRVADPTKAVFNVDDYKTYLSTQCDSTIRNNARLYPYDTMEDDTDEKTLRGSSLEIAEKMTAELQERVKDAGLEIEEVRITNLAYSDEIAAAMLQRQQAVAIIAARQKIVEGAVSMVKMAIDQLGEEEVVVLDEERKAAMVSNLLVVLCGNKDAQPIVNSGSIY